MTGLALLFFVKLGLLAVLVGFSALCSISETAFMSLSRQQLSRLRRVAPGRLAFWEDDPDKALAALLVANNLVNVGVGVLATSSAYDASRLWGIPFSWTGWIFPLVMGAIIIVLGEIFPKIVARAHPEVVALRLAPAVRGVSAVLGSAVSAFVDAIGSALARVSRSVKTERAQWTSGVIRTLLNQAPVSHPVRSILANLLDFGQKPVSKVMAPRAEMFTLDLGLPKKEFLERVLASDYSRVPVTKGSIDNIVGIVYAKDLLAFWRSEALIVVDDLVRPVRRVLPDLPLSQLLRDFRAGHYHMALVADHRDRVLGLVTLQDALDEITGEMAEEPGLPGAAPSKA